MENNDQKRLSLKALRETFNKIFDLWSQLGRFLQILVPKFDGVPELFTPVLHSWTTLYQRGWERSASRTRSDEIGIIYPICIALACTDTMLDNPSTAVCSCCNRCSQEDQNYRDSSKKSIKKRRWTRQLPFCTDTNRTMATPMPKPSASRSHHYLRSVAFDKEKGRTCGSEEMLYLLNTLHNCRIIASDYHSDRLLNI